jgi:hypothetical protein
MTSPNTKAPQATTANGVPWYDLIDDPEPPEDAMQQVGTIAYVMEVLRARYEGDPTVVWSSHTNIIYDSNVPGSFVAPDGFFVFGVDGEAIQRVDPRSYRIDQWGASPAFVLEVASESTAPNDMGPKREIYARMGAREYWRLDRTGEYYGEHLVGERLVDGQYQRYELHTAPNGDLWSRSEVLEVDFYFRIGPDGYAHFLLRDVSTREWLNTLGPERAARLAETAGRETAEAQAQHERHMRMEAEARISELQAQLDQLRRK